MSPFQIRQRWMSPNTSNTASRRTSSIVRRSLLASRSNWMARPTPNNSENSASAFRSTNSIRIVSTTLSTGDSLGLGKRNRSKNETRNSVTTFIATTPSRAIPRNTSMASIRSADPVGRGDVTPSAIEARPVVGGEKITRRSATAAYPVTAGPRSSAFSSPCWKRRSRPGWRRPRGSSRCLPADRGS